MVFLSRAHARDQKTYRIVLHKQERRLPKALTLIDTGEIELEPNTAFVVQEDCSGCRRGLTMCPYNAISRDGGKAKAYINEALCKDAVLV